MKNKIRRMTIKMLRVVSSAVGCLLALTAIAKPCLAGDIYVTSASDIGGGTTCTLRNALAAAYAHQATSACSGATSGHNTIHVPVGSYQITVTNAQGKLTPFPALDNVTITGSGASAFGTTVDANSASYVFRVARVTGDSSISGMAIHGARGGYNNSGPGVSVATGSYLGIGDCTFYDNHAAYSGGAVYFEPGSYGWIHDSMLYNNTADSFGGAIVLGANGYLEMENTTISYNTSGSQGGGVVLGGSADLTQCSIGNNSANTNGGGIYVTGGSVSVYSSTVAFNTLGVSGNGPGIFAQGGNTTIYRTVLSDNKAGATGADCGGILQSYGFSFVGYVPSNCSIYTSPGDSIGAGLAGLGGLGTVFRSSPFYLPAYMPSSTSPLLEKAPRYDYTDQLGRPRDPDGNNLQDIGAIER